MKWFAVLLSSAVLFAQPSKSGVDKTNLDTTCKPCDDFWRYANGGWIDRNPIPARHSSWGSFTTLDEENSGRLRAILESEAAKPAGSSKLGDYYAACLDTGALDRLGWSPLKPHFDRIAKIATVGQVAEEIRLMESYALRAPLSLSADSDLKNSKQNILWLGVGGLSLPEREYYLKDDERMKKIREEFLKHAARLEELTGTSPDAAKSIAARVLAFETSLARNYMPIVDRRNPEKIYNKTDRAGLEAMAPVFPWKALLDSVPGSPDVAINVTDTGGLKAFGKILAETPVEDWKTYLRWRWLNAAADSLSKPFRDQDFAFNGTVLQGKKEQLPRWQTCSQLADASLGEELGKAFVAKYFPPKAKARMSAMIENLQVTLREQIGSAPFLSDPTRKAAIEKLNAFLPKIGYPDKWRDYSMLPVSRTDFLGNSLASNRFERNYYLSQAGKPVDRLKWEMTPPTVNAYYNPALNEIVFPAGILQPPFFDMEADDAANYGAIGAVIGHEMGHGFDDQGSKFDAQGNLRNWWTDEDRTKFEDERAACIIDQFDNIDAGDGLRHNGRLVTGEALGDLGGLTIAYKAYQRSLGGKPGPVMDGLTSDQRFFLAFARVWGVNMRPERMRQLIQIDPHPLAKWRTNGTLANMPEFAAAFSCKRGDAMVRPPEKRCRLW